MKKRGLFFVMIVMATLAVIWVPQSGCSKDYSFEGADTTAIKDSLNLPPVITPPSQPFECGLCKETSEVPPGTWNFKTGNLYLCGSTTNSGFIGTNLTFTLFGPSACSIDTGLVMTVYLPEPFNESKFNVTTTRAAFYYYDHFGTNDIFISNSSALFTVKVLSYIYTTRIASGTFEGTVFRPNGDTAYIREGRFKVLLK